MAIRFTELKFRRLLADSGAAWDLAFLGRQPIFDTRLRRRFDFSQFNGDLVHAEISLPAGARRPTSPMLKFSAILGISR
jgi:hypothetical protein